jgi:hypothetical protein
MGKRSLGEGTVTVGCTICQHPVFAADTLPVEFGGELPSEPSWRQRRKISRTLAASASFTTSVRSRTSIDCGV